MPLVKGSSEKAISENIKRLNSESKDRSHAQIIAIAESIARKARQKKDY